MLNVSEQIILKWLKWTKRLKASELYLKPTNRIIYNKTVGRENRIVAKNSRASAKSS